MIKYLQNVVLALSVACIPPENDAEEDDLESSCRGEVLFEDEFDGSELDEGKWENNCTGPNEYAIQKGILEMRTDNGCGLNSRSTYTLDERTLCFEARWKVREREGTDFVDGLIEIDYAGLGFALDSETQRFTYDANEGDCFSDLREISGANLSQFNTYRVAASRQKADFYLNDELLGTIRDCIPSNNSLEIYFSCQSRDDTEKQCSIDSVKLER